MDVTPLGVAVGLEGFPPLALFGCQGRLVDRRSQHGEVDPDQTIRKPGTERSADRRAPVAAMSAEAVVAELGHELDPNRGDAPAVHPASARLTGKSVTRQR